MSWKAEANKIYEAQVVKDALDRLAKRIDTKNLPLSAAELHTIAKRAREAMWSKKKRDRLDRYKVHLSTLYGEECVGPIAAALEEINNEIVTKKNEPLRGLVATARRRVRRTLETDSTRWFRQETAEGIVHRRVKPLQRLRRRVTVLLVALACIAATIWHAESHRMRSALVPVPPGPPTAASLTFEELVDSAEALEAGFRLALDTIPRHDEPRRLQSTIGYLKSVTYLYYDWASGRGEEAISAEAIQRGYVMPAVESIAEARPELAAAHPGVRRAAAVRLYFLDQRMLLSYGVLLSTSGLGRFPSLELAPIAKEIPMDQVVWGRRIDAVGFDLREPIILDIVSWSHGASTGPNMRTAGTIVCHHLDREAEFVETLRMEIRHARRGPPGPARDASTLMQGLVYVALQPYLALDNESAEREFLEDWWETSYMHEAGHIFSRQAGLGLTPQTAQEEALAYLTELRFGGTPHYTLRNMVSVGMVEGIRPHKDGMEVVFAEFSQHIFAATVRGNGFEAIDFSAIAESAVDGAGIGGIVYQFPKLKEDEIRALADRVFEEKYRARVKE